MMQVVPLGLLHLLIYNTIKKVVVKSNYLGPSYSNVEVKNIIKDNKLLNKYNVIFKKSDAKLLEFIVRKIKKKYNRFI